MIKISEKAAEHIKYIKNRDQITNTMPLRVSVKEGGCSGFSYKLDFNKEVTDRDKIFSDYGVSLVIERKSLLYLMGTTLDFDGSLNGKGFIFSNPNAKETCGCGSSFAV